MSQSTPKLDDLFSSQSEICGSDSKIDVSDLVTKGSYANVRGRTLIDEREAADEPSRLDARIVFWSIIASSVTVFAAAILTIVEKVIAIRAALGG